MAYLVQPLALAAQVREVLLASVDQQDLQQVDLEATLVLHHPASALIMELETSAPQISVHLEASVSVREALVDSPFSARDKERQAVFLGQVLDLVAPTSAREQDLHLQAPGQERVPEAVALPHRAHKDLSQGV